jgi:23S rRNA (uracil1939-C5)-methyltransferase
MTDPRTPDAGALRRGDIIELEVHGIDERGQGLAEPPSSGRTVVVPGLFAGERGRVQIEALSRHKPLAFAWLRERTEESPHRRELLCPRHQDSPGGSDTDVDADVDANPDGERAGNWAGRGGSAASRAESARSKPACAGCPLMALDLAGQRAAKRAMVAREHGLELDALIGGEELGYRWSSKRVVAGRRGGLVLGSRVASRRQRDWIADMRGCLVDHPAITAAFAAVEDRANELGLEPWREGAGDLRYVWAKTNGEAVVLTLITGAAHSRAAAELGPRLVAEGIVAGVAHSVQAGSSNAIRGEDTRVVAGEVALALRLPEIPELSLEVGPLGFLQPNPRVAALAYRDLVGPPPGGSDVWVEDRLGELAGELAGEAGGLACDLYAGAGVTTALLRERFAEVVACEAYPESAAALGVAPETAEAWCESWLAAGRPTPKLIVANPPRAGLGEQVCAGLRAIGPERIHIMSCNPATLRADLDRLCAGEGGYELVAVRGYDTLPQTAHVELVAWLRRG